MTDAAKTLTSAPRFCAAPPAVKIRYGTRSDQVSESVAAYYRKYRGIAVIVGGPGAR